MAPSKSPLLQKMCDRCIERDKNLPECAERRYFCDYYICSEQPKKRRAQEEVTDEKISIEVKKLEKKGNSRNTSMIMVASRFGLGMPVIRSRYARYNAPKPAAPKKQKAVKKAAAAPAPAKAATGTKAVKKKAPVKKAVKKSVKKAAKKIAKKTVKKAVTKKTVKKKTAAKSTKSPRSRSTRARSK